MTSYAIHKGDRRIGTVMSFAGEPRRTRWVGYASEGRHMGFPTLKEATSWLNEVDAETQKGPPAEADGPIEPLNVR